MATSRDSADALAEQIGINTVPDITRKITACAACRKQKIKCHMRDGEAPCTRCKKRGLSCTINKSLQSILQNDVSWKHAIEQKIRQLESTLSQVTDKLALPGPEGTATDIDDLQRMRLLQDSSAQLNGDSTRTSQRASREVASISHDGQKPQWEVVMDDTSGPAAIPGSVLSLGAHDSNMRPDLLSRGIITNARAQEFLDCYHNRLDHFVYRILGDSKTLNEIRQSSSLLLAAICAVGSLHLASPDFDSLYQEFVSIASAQSFSRRLNTDDVRGLCIGAFWLSGISWACVANAVRISTEIQLQRSAHRAIQGGADDRAHYLRTRLYYLVFVCDHHFSIPYGRPPMTPSCDAIQANAQFLESRHAVEDDFRLVSQLRLWQVSANIYLTFGGDVDRPLKMPMLEPIRRFGIELDSIRLDWTERFSQNHYVGNYPRKGVGLHSHFAKLYLYSHAFRGLTHPDFRPADIELEIDELTNAALLAATSILQTVVSDQEIQQFLNGLPTYFDVMIAFAVVFLLKVSTGYADHVRVDVVKVQRLVEELVVVLKNVTSSMHARHILVSVARGAEILLQKCEVALSSTSVLQQQQLQQQQREQSQAVLPAIDQQYFDQSFYDIPVNWSDMALDNFYMGDFDFLSNQTAFGGS